MEKNKDKPFAASGPLKEIIESLTNDMQLIRQHDKAFMDQMFKYSIASIIGLSSLSAIGLYFESSEIFPYSLELFIGFALLLFLFLQALLLYKSFIMRKNHLRYFQIDTARKADLLKSLIQKSRSQRDKKDLPNSQENIIEEIRLMEAEALLKALEKIKKS